MTLCLLVSLSGLVMAEEGPRPLPMEASFGAETAETGDLIPVELSFSLPQGASLGEDIRISGFESGQLQDSRRTDKGLELTLLVDGLESFHVDSLELLFTDRDGNAGTFKSEPLALSVTNRLIKDPSRQKIKPLKGLVEVVPMWRRVLPYVLIGLAVVVLVAVVLLLLLHRRQAEAQGPPLPPPDEVALKSLKKLALDWKKGVLEEKEYYFRLSAIVRVYMEGIRPFPAAELTTEEITARIREEPDREALIILREADLVKFAGKQPTESAREEHYRAAGKYVDTTRPVLDPESQGEKP